MARPTVDLVSRSLRVLTVTQPGVSHLFPMLPVLRALRRRGHEVVVASAPRFAAQIAAVGLRPASMGVDFTVGLEHTFVPALATARARRDASFEYTRIVLVEALASAAVEGLREIVGDWHPDVIVRDPAEFGSFAIAEALGIPHVTGRENRFLSTEAWAAELGDSLTRLARLTGADALHAGQLYRYLGLAPMLPSLVAATPELDNAREFGSHVGPTIRFVRPETYGSGGSDGSNDRNGPRVLVTLGTVFHDQPQLLRHVLAASESVPAHFTVITGPGVDPALFQPVPEDVLMTEFIPLGAVLPACAAVVTAGGLGTVLAALEHQLPMVLMPVNADQPTNAARCEGLGVGIAVPASRASPATIAAAITWALTDACARARAVELSGEFRWLTAPDQAAQLVEAVAYTGVPVPDVAESAAR